MTRLVRMRKIWNTCACWQDCKMVQTLNSIKVPKQLKIELPCDPTIPFLCVYPKELKEGSEEIFAHPSQQHYSQ